MSHRLRAHARATSSLVCPWCHDGAAPDDHVVTCARAGCGAPYHRECWEECVARFGGCAVYGCATVESCETTWRGQGLRAMAVTLAFYLWPLAPRSAVHELAGREAAIAAAEQWRALAPREGLSPWRRALRACVGLALALALAQALLSPVTGGELSAGSLAASALVVGLVALLSRAWRGRLEREPRGPRPPRTARARPRPRGC